MQQTLRKSISVTMVHALTLFPTAVLAIGQEAPDTTSACMRMVNQTPFSLNSTFEVCRLQRVTDWRKETSTQNALESARLVKQAFDKQEAHALTEVGYFLLQSTTASPEDKTHGIELLKSASAKSDVNATVELGVAYSRGNGVTRNDNEAYKWLLLAMKQDSWGYGALAGSILLYNNDLHMWPDRALNLSLAKQWSAEARNSADPNVAALATRVRPSMVQAFALEDNQKADPISALSDRNKGQLGSSVAAGLLVLFLLGMLSGSTGSHTPGRYVVCHYGEPDFAKGEWRGIGGIPTACGWQ